MKDQKHHLEMNRVKQISALLLSVLLSFTVVVAENYDRVERRNIWNGGGNATGVLRDTTTISYAELYYSGEQGDFRNFSDASSLWSAGVEAKTITHFDKLSMIGSFSYDHTEGKDMCGSMFISPNEYPFDILEFTPGDKRLQSYSMMGGIATQLDDRWSIGVKSDFKSQNYVKYKDLRHYNYRMELSIRPSVSYKIDQVTLGLNYVHARNSETIRVQEVGSTAAAYYAFLDKGLMRGAYETWGGTGVHLDESGIDGFPVRENFNGVAGQIEWRDLYCEFEYLKGGGEVGEKLTYWFEFPSQQYTARLGYKKRVGNKLHLFQVEAQHYSLTNNENVLGSVTENGITTTVIYGSNEIFSTKCLSLNPRYEIMFIDGGDVAVGGGYYHTFERATQMYPYVDELTTNVYQLYLSGMLPINNFELRAKALCSTGTLNEDSYKSSDSVDVGDSPTHLEEYYNINNEYLTATTLNSMIAVRYNLPRSLYCEVEVANTHAFDIDYIGGNSRWSYTVKAGYKF